MTREEQLREFADKLEKAIKARDFSDDWTPISVQRSCAEMVHEVLEDEMGVSASGPTGDWTEHASHVKPSPNCHLCHATAKKEKKP